MLMFFKVVSVWILLGFSISVALELYATSTNNTRNNICAILIAPVSICILTFAYMSGIVRELTSKREH